MTATVDARAALYAALVASPYLGGADRVHRYKPRTIATPAVWVGDVTSFGRTVDGFNELALEFELVAVVDGDDTAALELLDTLADALVDAATAAGATLASRRPTTLDVGGPQLRAVAVFADYPVHAPTLCPPITVTVNGATADV